MKKFNLFNEIIITDKKKLLLAINSGKLFGIDIDGNIINEPFGENEIFIYKDQAKIIKEFTKVLGKNYQLVEDEDRVLIKAFSNWQELIAINTPNSSYDDTTADGVGEFADKSLEDIGWHISEFKVDYRTLVDMLEKNCEGTLLCIEQDEPYQFSGLGYLSDNLHAKEVLFDYCKSVVEEKIANDPDFELEHLTDDEADAAKFFGVI
ncbi:MAG: hypothetical protein JJW00_02950 [Sulfurimonas sp.]|nr:hypothetical protein [Sulfurimonas sp.]